MATIGAARSLPCCNRSLHRKSFGPDLFRRKSGIV